jgi:hypothetical protein
MDRSKRPSLAFPPAAAKLEAAPKPRKKLQKVAKQRNLLSKRPISEAANEEYSDNNNKLDTANKPSLPLPPDLGSPIWEAFVRPSGDLSVVNPSPRQSTDSHKPPAVAIIPEFAHLNTNNDKPRSSTETLATESTQSSTSILRRQAKTPILRIGQLEAQARARNMPQVIVTKPREADNKVCAEVIAEQYRSLLGSGESVYEDSHSAPSRPEEHRGLGMRRGHSPTGLPQETEEPQSATLKFVSRSPTSSDDGTLVSFQEDTVYFKPVSFSPEPKSPARSYDDFLPACTPPLTPNKLSLQICVDLLARDLGPAVTNRPRRTPTEETALQVWIMIEAYERLREQILDSGLRYDEVLSLEVMFDTWLKALYRVHGSLIGSEQASVSDYDELERATEGVQLD